MWAARRPLFRGVAAAAAASAPLPRFRVLASAPAATAARPPRRPRSLTLPERLFATGEAEAAPASPCCDAVLSRIRRRAGPQLAAAANRPGGARGGALAAAEAAGALNRVVSEELDAAFPPPPAAGAAAAAAAGDGASASASTTVDPRAACVQRVAREIDGPASDLQAAGELGRERNKLQAQRADCLAVGFQSQGAENMEFGSLVVCAIAEIFAVSIHYGFFAIFGLAYMMYRRSTKATRIQRASTDELQGILDRLRELDELEAERWAAVRAYGEAWQAGLPGPSDGTGAAGVIGAPPAGGAAAATE